MGIVHIVPERCHLCGTELHGKSEHPCKGLQITIREGLPQVTPDPIEEAAREFIKDAELVGKGWDTERKLIALLRSRSEAERDAALLEAARAAREVSPHHLGCGEKIARAIDALRSGKGG